MFDKFHIFLGATVADAAARPLHWIYDQKILQKHIKGMKDFAFIKDNKSPFYSIKTGKVSGYNDVGQVMFRSLRENRDEKSILTTFKKNVVKNFGPGSLYWKNLALRKKYKKIKWRSKIKGPWIHQNIMEAIQNIKKKKKITGGIKVNESDGYCAALPYFLYYQSFKNIKRVVSTVANTKLSIKYALAKLMIIDLADKGLKSPVDTFVRQNKSKSYFKEVIVKIKEVKSLKAKPHNLVVKKMGMACSYAGTFCGSIHAIITSRNYKSAVLKTIKAGGCNCSRANFVGAYFAAFKGIKSIPKEWIKKTETSKSFRL
jgi:hypothetical protein